jgi:hypothetical protein
MGLTIHYSGRITDKHKLPQLIEELEEISKVQGWDYRVFEREFPHQHSETFTLSESLTKNDEEHDGKLYGIFFVPDGCDPVSITFLSNGRISGPMQLQCWGDSTDEKERKMLYGTFTKTQYAGEEVHKRVIGVFRYLNNRFLSDLKIYDEGEYWETNDEKLLTENFRRNTDLINSFARALRENNRLENESVDEYLERIIREFRNKNQ